MKDDDKEMTTAAAPAPVKKSRMKMVFVLVGSLLVLGGGAAAGGYWWMARNGAQAANGEQQHEPADKIGPHSGIVALEQFTVNLADQDASRFLRATVHLVIDEGREADEIKENA